jgi:hypothetical protein
MLEGTSWVLRSVRFKRPADVTITSDNKRTLSQPEAGELARAISESRFWAEVGSNADPKGIVEGSTWIVEGRRDSGYQLVRRRSMPAVDDPLRALIDVLAELAGFSDSQLFRDKQRPT